MAWVRLEDRFTSDPKIVELSDAEFRVWIRVLCHCGAAKDPTVDTRTKREVSGLNSRRIEHLFRLGLLIESGDDFEVNNWAKYQPKDVTSAERQAAWRARKRAKAGVTNGVTDTVTPDVTEIVTPTVTSSRAGASVPSRSTGESASSALSPTTVEPKRTTPQPPTPLEATSAAEEPLPVKAECPVCGPLHDVGVCFSLEDHVGNVHGLDLADVL